MVLPSDIAKLPWVFGWSAKQMQWGENRGERARDMGPREILNF